MRAPSPKQQPAPSRNQHNRNELAHPLGIASANFLFAIALPRASIGPLVFEVRPREDASLQTRHVRIDA